MTSLPDDADEISSSPPSPHQKPEEEVEMEEEVVENASMKVNPATSQDKKPPSRLMITHMVRTLSHLSFLSHTHHIHALPSNHIVILGT